MKKHSLIAVLLISVMTLSLVGCQKKDTGVLVDVGDTNVNNTDNKEKYNADDTELDVVGGNTTDTSTTEATKEEKVRETSVEKSWYSDGNKLTLKDGRFMRVTPEETRTGEYTFDSNTITLKYIESQEDILKDVEEFEIVTEYVDENGNVVEDYTENENHEIVDSNGNILYEQQVYQSSNKNEDGEPQEVYEGDVEIRVPEEVEIKLNIVELTAETLTITDENGNTIEYKTNE